MASGVSVEIDWICDGHVDGDQGPQGRSIVRAKKMSWKSFGSLRQGSMHVLTGPLTVQHSEV